MRGDTITNKNFCSTMKSFLINKGLINKIGIIVKKGNKTIIECNKHYINIVENTSGKKPVHVARDSSIFDTDQVIELIKQSFLGHSIISRIKQNSSIRHFCCGNEICLTTPNEILKFLKETVTKQTSGFDMIHQGLLK